MIGKKFYKKYKRKQEQMCKQALSKHHDTLTAEERDSVRTQLMVKQDGCCAICGQPQKDLKRKLALDHCHVTGRVRGLLCNNCNLLLGCAKDNVYRLQSAVDYLSEGVTR